MNFYVVGQETEAVKKFFSTLPESDRPRVISDTDHPNAWEHPTDEPTVIVTSEPRMDTDAKEISIDGKQPDEVLQQMVGNDSDQTDDMPEPEAEEEPVTGPLTYRDRGFKVGRIS